MMRPATKIAENTLPPIDCAISNAAEDSSAKLPPGCTSCVKYVTTMKIAPPMSAMSRIARGMTRCGFFVSSVSVVTASKPRNEYAATAAAPMMLENCAFSPTNGEALTSAPAPSARTTLAMLSTTKIAMTRNWNAMSTKFTRSATLMPTMFSTVVTTMNAMIHTQLGTPGTAVERYEAPMSQITIGRKR